MKPAWVSGNKNVGFWLGNLAEGDVSDGTHRGYYFQLHGSTKGYNIGVIYDSNGTGLHDKYDQPKWTPDTWYTIEVMRSDGEIKFYVNDELIGTDTTYASQMTEMYWVTGRSWKEGRYGEAAKIHIDDFEVSVKSISIKPPIANFTYLPVSLGVGETVTFNASGSYDPDGTIEKYEWDFGDGNTTTTTEEIITHSYSSSGNYNVNLTVTDDGGLTNSTSKTVTVNPVVPTAVFDTDAGTYPSIFGTHKGTIKPNQTIAVQKLYTYPCAGTGGHTEHVRIWNDTWIGKEAHWKGYKDDWHNITFDEPFTLFAEKTYNYEIRTGSYPQIIHKPEHTTLDGSFINCTLFVDANGKEYTNWIPAIRLWP